MSRVLIGSISTSMPASPAFFAAHARLLQVGRPQRRARVAAGGHQAGHQVHARAAERGGVLEGPVEAAPELGLAAGQGGDAALALGEVARRRVEQHLLQAVSLQRRASVSPPATRRERGTRPPRSRRRGRGEALEERHARRTSWSGWRRSAASRSPRTVLPAGAELPAQLVDLRRRQRRRLRLAAEPEARGLLAVPRAPPSPRRASRARRSGRAATASRRGSARREPRPGAIASATCSPTSGAPGRW